jgi:hypothetical protein
MRRGKCCSLGAVVCVPAPGIASRFLIKDALEPSAPAAGDKCTVIPSQAIPLAKLLGPPQDRRVVNYGTKAHLHNFAIAQPVRFRRFGCNHSCSAASAISIRSSATAKCPEPYAVAAATWISQINVIPYRARILDASFSAGLGSVIMLGVPQRYVAGTRGASASLDLNGRGGVPELCGAGLAGRLAGSSKPFPMQPSISRNVASLCVKC